MKEVQVKAPHPPLVTESQFRRFSFNSDSFDAVRVDGHRMLAARSDPLPMYPNEPIPLPTPGALFGIWYPGRKSTYWRNEIKKYGPVMKWSDRSFIVWYDTAGKPANRDQGDILPIWGNADEEEDAEEVETTNGDKDQNHI